MAGLAEAHPTVEIRHLLLLIGKAKLPKKPRDCQEKGMQYKQSIFLLDELLQLRYNLPAAGWLMLFSRPVPRGVGEADDVHARLPHQLRLASVRNYSTTITPGSSNRQDMRLWTVESGFESLPRNCCNGKAPSSRGQGRCPLTAETRVRISVGPLRKSNTARPLLTASLPR